MYFVELLDYAGAYSTTAREVNNLGRAAGDQDHGYGGDSRPVFWDSQGAVDVWSTPSYASRPGRVLAMNDSNDILLEGLDPGAFLYRGGSLINAPGTPLGVLYPRDINNAA